MNMQAKNGRWIESTVHEGSLYSLDLTGTDVINAVRSLQGYANISLGDF